MVKKVILVLLVVVLLLTVGYFASMAYIISQESWPPVNQNLQPYRAELSGEYVCLMPPAGSKPPFDQCLPSIKTTTGEYYVMDFTHMLQTYDPLVVGTQFTATGLVRPVIHTSTDHWQQYDIKGAFSVTDSLVVKEDELVIPTACSMDARICPDGSAVGRSGPRCEFAACPPATATSSTLTTYLGGTATGLSVSATPKKVISDSRCPATVVCVWAGTVEVQTVLATPVSHGEHVLTLGKPQLFGDYTVTLVAVMPDKTEAAIPDSSYRFTYTVVKNNSL